jgi:tetratricopeptide (TPR) repeat protein
MDRSIKLVRWLILCLVLAAAYGCGSAKERKAQHMQQAKSLLANNQSDKALVELKNVLQIDPKDIEARFELAQLLEKMRDFRGAASHFNAVLGLDQNHVGAHVEMGQILLMAQQLDDALGHAEAILKLNPKNADALAIRGVVRVRRGDEAAGLADGQAALAAEPGNVRATSFLASLFVKQGKKDEAIRLLQSGVKAHSEELGQKILLASLYADSGANDQAFELLNAVIAQEPDVLGHRVRLAQVYTQAKRLDEAEKTLRAAIGTVKDNEAAKLALVDFLAARRSPDAAVRELQTMIQASPDTYALRFGLARLHLYVKHPDQAESVYRDIIQRDGEGPNGLKARTQLAVVMAQAGKMEDANALLNAVIEKNSKDAEALGLRAKLALAKGETAKAIPDLRAVLQQQPNSAEMLRLLARAHLAQNEVGLAQDALRKAVEVDPTEPEARKEYARLLASQNQPDKAMEQINSILKNDPKNASALETTFRFAASRQDWAKAQDIAVKAKQAAPDKATGYQMLGLTLQGRQDYAGAISEFSQALERDPKSVDSLVAVVRNYEALKQPEKGIAFLQDFAKKHPDGAEAYAILGSALGNAKHFKTAETSLRKALSLNPKYPQAYRALAGVYSAQNDQAKALATFLEGLKNIPDDPGLVVDIGSLYERTGQPEKAIEHYEDVVKRNPKASVVINNLAQLLADHRKDAASLDRAQTLVKELEAAKQPAFMDTVGWVHYRRGELGKAVSILEGAVTAAPQAPVLHYHLGMAYLGQGNAAKAREHLVKAVETNRPYTGLEEAKTALKGLPPT